MASASRLAELVAYVGFGPEHAAALARVGPLLQPSFPAIARRFYDAIFARPGASSALDGTEAQASRLRETLVAWLGGIFCGVYDDAYYERRARIGRVHDRVGLEQLYMFGAMNVVRTCLQDAVTPLELSAEERRVTHQAIDMICDLELSIMLETHRDALVARIQAHERLATLGFFAAAIGHDLRNPLAVIETSAHLLARAADADERSRKHLARITEQVGIAGRIISDLLELAREGSLPREPVKVHLLVAEVVSAAPARDGVALEVESPQDLPPAVLERARVRQALLNLVQNALQAATSGVWVRATRDGGGLRLCVEDDGPGISAEAAPMLFEPLFTTKLEGSGLGLAICRRVAERHGGSVSGANRREGGARFELWFPEVFE